MIRGGGLRFMLGVLLIARVCFDSEAPIREDSASKPSFVFSHPCPTRGLGFRVRAFRVPRCPAEAADVNATTDLQLT